MENPLSFKLKNDFCEWSPSNTDTAVQHLIQLCDEIESQNVDIRTVAEKIRVAMQCENCKEEEQSVVLAALARTIPYITEDHKLVQWFTTEGRRLLQEHETLMNRKEFQTRSLAYYCSSQLNFRQVDADQMLQILTSCPIDKHVHLIRAAASAGNHNAIHLLMQSGCKRWDMLADGPLERLYNGNFASTPHYLCHGSTQPGQVMAWILALGEKQLIADYGPPLAAIPMELVATLEDWSREPRVHLCIENARDGRDNTDSINALRAHVQESCVLCKHDARSVRLFRNFPPTLLESDEDILVGSTPCWDYLKAICVVVFQRDEDLFRDMFRMLSNQWQKPECTYDDDRSHYLAQQGFDLILPLLVAACMGDFKAVRFVLFYLPKAVKINLYSRTAHTVGSYAAFCGQMTVARAFARFGWWNHSISVAAAYYGDFDIAFQLCEPDGNHEQWRQEQVEDEQTTILWYILRVAAIKGRIDVLQEHLPLLLTRPRAHVQKPESSSDFEGVWKVERLLAAAIEGDSMESARFLIGHVSKFGPKKFCKFVLANGPSLEMVRLLLPKNYDDDPSELLKESVVALLAHPSPGASFKGPIEFAFEMVGDNVEERYKMALHHFDKCIDFPHLDHVCETCNLAEMLDIFLQILGRDAIKRSTVRRLLRNKHCANVMRVMTKFIKSHVFLDTLRCDQSRELTGAVLFLYGLGIPFAPYHHHDLFKDHHLCAIYSYGRRQPNEWGDQWRRVQILAQAFDEVQLTITSSDVMNLIHGYWY